MMKTFLSTTLFSLYITLSYCQSEPPIAELGAAVGKTFKKGPAAYGPNIGIEFTPIEDWLEIEADLTPLIANHTTEWAFDLLFKKPFTLSKKLEFMAGLGPELSYSKADNTTLGLEVAGDLMYWPWPLRKIGLYLEPNYDLDFARGNEQSIGLSAGLLIPFK